MTKTFGAFTVKIDKQQIALVTIDVKGEKQNTLKVEFAEQFTSLMEHLSTNDKLLGVIIVSGKDNSFVAGADISMLEAADSEQTAFDISQQGQKAFQLLQEFRVPVIAAINGACLGGGLELALACHGRVVANTAGTVLGLPEVQLGLLPGGGGTQRLPRLIGIENALDMMLTGKRIKPPKAKKMGLVDEMTHPKHLILASRKLLAKLQRSSAPSQPDSGLSNQLKKAVLEKNNWGRQLLFSQARKKIMSRTGGHYPAPEYIIDAVEIGIENGLEAGYKVESELFAKLVVSEVAKELIQIFFATTALKNQFPCKNPDKIKRVGVLGCGLMGSGIVYTTLAKTQKQVRMKDTDNDALLRGYQSVYSIFKKRLKKKRITPSELNHQMQKLSSSTNFNGFQNSDLIIEAVFEDLSLKQSIVKEVESWNNQDLILATNTSSIPISDIANGAKHPEKIIGMHYFSPVDKMPLLEIIKTDKTAPDVVSDCVRFGTQQGKTVIVVNDGPGFYTSRILAPYMNEAGFLLSEGCAIDVIDQSLQKLGFPVGPFKLLDEVGIDVGTKIGPILVKALGKRLLPPEIFTKLAETERLGKKNKFGFYVYNGSSHHNRVDESIYDDLNIKIDQKIASEVASERCLLQMLNEAAYCFQENILMSASDGDIGAVFGIGFPPFLGGPFRYMDAVGVTHIVERLKYYQELHGNRFKPAAVLTKMSKAVKKNKFYL